MDDKTSHSVSTSTGRAGLGNQSNKLLKNKGGNNTKHDWWYTVDTWFQSKMTEWGEEMNSKAWKKQVHV